MTRVCVPESLVLVASTMQHDQPCSDYVHIIALRIALRNSQLYPMC